MTAIQNVISLGIKLDGTQPLNHKVVYNDKRGRQLLLINLLIVYKLTGFRDKSDNPVQQNKMLLDNVIVVVYILDPRALLFCA